MLPLLLSALGSQLVPTHAGEHAVHTASICVGLYMHGSCWFRGLCYLGVLHPLYILHSFHLCLCFLYFISIVKGLLVISRRFLFNLNVEGEQQYELALS